MSKNKLHVEWGPGSYSDIINGYFTQKEMSKCIADKQENIKDLNLDLGHVHIINERKDDHKLEIDFAIGSESGTMFYTSTTILYDQPNANGDVFTKDTKINFSPTVERLDEKN